MEYILAIGDRSNSSWSLRGWLMFVRFGLDVTLRPVRMFTPTFGEVLRDFGAARTVPALRVLEADGSGFVLWDTLAMAETLVERHPDIDFWPKEPAARALARTLVAEMHAGFGALRAACPMNLRRSYDGFTPSEEVAADIARIEQLWSLAREGWGEGGPWLFGAAYTLADVFFAPVAGRIATYGLPVSAETGRYVAAHLADPLFREWRAAGLADPYVQAGYDLDLPEKAWPGGDA